MRDTICLFGRPVNGAVLAKRVGIANFYTGRRVFVACVLWMGADDASREEVVVFANRCHTRNDHVRFNQCVVADRNMRSNDTKMPNPNILSE